MGADEDQEVFPESQSSGSKLSDEQEEQIASFFEDHPCFYDMTSPDYKNNSKKNALLGEISDVMGIPPTRILRRFTSIRSDHFKLKHRKKGKSGKGQVKLTPLQTFKLNRYKFLEPHYKGRVQSSTLGDVATHSSSEEEEDDGAYSIVSASVSADDPTRSQDNDSMSKKMYKRATKPGKKDLSEVLTELLTETKRDLRQTQIAVGEASISASRPTSERDAWAQWLHSIHNEIPQQHWRAYQQETSMLAMRYLWSYGATLQQQPPQQQLAMQQQPQQQFPMLPQQQPPSQQQLAMQQQPQHQFPMLPPHQPPCQQQQFMVPPQQQHTQFPVLQQQQQNSPIVFQQAPQQTPVRPRSAAPATTWELPVTSISSPQTFNLSDFVGSQSQTPTVTSFSASFTQTLTQAANIASTSGDEEDSQAGTSQED